MSEQVIVAEDTGFGDDRYYHEPCAEEEFGTRNPDYPTRVVTLAEVAEKQRACARCGIDLGEPGKPDQPQGVEVDE